MLWTRLQRGGARRIRDRVPAALARRLATPCARDGRPPEDGEGGFILLESLIAIALITVIMSALGVLFLNVVATSGQQRARATAVQVATTTMENLTSRDATSLVSGRLNTTQFATSQATSAPVAAFLSGMTPALDVDPGSTGIPTVPTAPTTQQIGSLTYSITQYLGWCYNVVRPDGSATCGTTQTGSAVRYLRAVIAVSWNSPRCDTVSCTYVTSSLISASSDPTFNANQPLPAAPSIADPDDQASYVGTPVSLQLGVQDDTGVPPLIWTNPTGFTLPAGLALDSAGLVSGTPTATTSGAVKVKFVVTDAFGRSDSVTLNWQVFPKITVTTPAPQVSLTGDTVKLPLTASGGQGTPYAWSLATGALPPGLTVDPAGNITGNPTTQGQYLFTLRVVDRAGGGAATTGTISWTVGPPPVAATTPASQRSTIGTPITGLALSATGGDGRYVWSDNGTLPDGLSIDSATGIVTGTPKTLNSYAVRITVSDPTGGSDPRLTQVVQFTWSVVKAPTVSAPADQVDSVGSPVSIQLTTTCPNSPCTYKLNSGPTGPSIDGSGLMTGTVTGTAKQYTGLTVTVTDAAGAQVSSSTFSWLVNPAPRLLSPGDQITQPSSAVSLDMSALASGGTGAYKFTATGLPSWLTLNATSGKITGTAPSGSQVTSNIVVTLTDATNAKYSAPAFSWTVSSSLKTNFDDHTVTQGKAFSISLNDGTTTGGITPYSWSVSGLPSWARVSGSTLSGTAPSQSAKKTVAYAGTLTVTDSKGTTARTGFTLYVTDLTWTLTDASYTTPRNQNLGTITAKSYVSGGSGVYTFSATSLPPGLSVDPNTGYVTGYPSKTGTFNADVTVTDSVGAVAHLAFTWYVT